MYYTTRVNYTMAAKCAPSSARMPLPLPADFNPDAPRNGDVVDATSAPTPAPVDADSTLKHGEAGSSVPSQATSGVGAGNGSSSGGGDTFTFSRPLFVPSRFDAPTGGPGPSMGGLTSSLGRSGSGGRSTGPGTPLLSGSAFPDLPAVCSLSMPPAHPLPTAGRSTATGLTSSDASLEYVLEPSASRLQGGDSAGSGGIASDMVGELSRRDLENALRGGGSTGLRLPFPPGNNLSGCMWFPGDSAGAGGAAGATQQGNAAREGGGSDDEEWGYESQGKPRGDNAGNDGLDDSGDEGGAIGILAQRTRLSSGLVDEGSVGAATGMPHWMDQSRYAQSYSPYAASGLDSERSGLLLTLASTAAAEAAAAPPAPRGRKRGRSSSGVAATASGSALPPPAGAPPDGSRPAKARRRGNKGDSSRGASTKGRGRGRGKADRRGSSLSQPPPPCFFPTHSPLDPKVFDSLEKRVIGLVHGPPQRKLGKYYGATEWCCERCRNIFKDHTKPFKRPDHDVRSVLRKLRLQACVDVGMRGYASGRAGNSNNHGGSTPTPLASQHECAAGRRTLELLEMVRPRSTTTSSSANAKVALQ